MRGSGGTTLDAVTTEAVLDALRRVPHPRRGGDVVGLGMVSGVVVKDGNVGFAIEVDPAEARELEPLRRACEQAVRALPGVLSCAAVLTAERAPGGAARPQPARPAAACGRRPAPRRSSRWCRA